MAFRLCDYCGSPIFGGPVRTETASASVMHTDCTDDHADAAYGADRDIDGALMAALTVPLPVDLDAVVPCVGYWSGDDVEHTQHTPCPNPAAWAGRSDHDHAKTTLRCTPHRDEIDLAVLEDTMFCLTCKGHIRTMNWREL